MLYTLLLYKFILYKILLKYKELFTCSGVLYNPNILLIFSRHTLI
jgi:hypothetical protein